MRRLARSPVAAAAVALTLISAVALTDWDVRAQQATPPNVPAASRPATRATSRPAPRPALSREQYIQLADELRAVYGKPPEQWPPPTLDEGVEHRELGHSPKPLFPAENAYSVAKAELGRTLFFDPLLSGSKQVACATCHDPDLGFSDGKRLSFGHDRSLTQRNAPGLLNLGQQRSFFWDGRAATLEEQLHEPIVNQGEMHSNFAEVVERLRAIPDYQKLFALAFGEAGEHITAERIAKAIATFERTIVGGRSAFDRFLAGQTKALDDAQVRGLHLFRTQARCMNCHAGPNFTDEKFHDLGLSYFRRKLQDLGRYEVTKDPADVGRFRTPSLRNVKRTAPYMHVGLFELRGVLNMYNAGMPTIRPNEKTKEDPLFPTKSPLLRALALNQQDLDDLEAFLDALTEPKFRVRPPPLPGREPIVAWPTTVKSTTAPADVPLEDDAAAAAPPALPK